MPKIEIYLTSYKDYYWIKTETKSNELPPQRNKHQKNATRSQRLQKSQTLGKGLHVVEPIMEIKANGAYSIEEARSYVGESQKEDIA